VASRKRTRPAAFTDIVCAVNGSRGSVEAARQAIALAGPDGALTFVAVFYSAGTGLAETAGLNEKRARKALDESAGLAYRVGVPAATKLRKGRSPNRVLLSECKRHELMVLGSHGGSRVGGILLGSTATRAAHNASGALLVARRPVGKWRDFPTSILVATDGSAGSWAAARTAGRIARVRGSRIVVLHVPNEPPEERRQAVVEQVAAIQKLTGANPAVTDGGGQVAERIVDTARSERCSLIAIGRRGLTGLRAIGSVSERVAHQARCSVLVVPPAADSATAS
jgi:nucleotide-binding universal stress UspA family protein